MKVGLFRMCAVGLFVGVLIAGCRLDLTNLFADNTGDFLTTGKTFSHFQAVQIDPRSEDTAGPTFVKSADLDNDGRLDLVTAWSQSQPVQIHLQRISAAGEISFETATIAGAIPVSSTADIDVADFDGDGHVDIAVLAKSRELPDGPAPQFDGAVIVFFGPDDPATVTDPFQWQEVLLGQTAIQGAADGDGTDPEVGGYTDMELGEMTGDGAIDLVLALNAAEDSESGMTGRVELFVSPGPDRARRGGEWDRFQSPTTGEPSLEVRESVVKDVALMDVDHDSDLDVIVTRPDSQSMNVRWLRNQLVNQVGLPTEWTSHAVGHVATGADVLLPADVDGDGLTDVIVRSSNGGIIQWFKGPQTPAVTRNVPWQVFTLAEFLERTPQAVGFGDLDFDGQPEMIAAAQGGLAFFDSATAPSILDQWTENLIVDDQPSADEENPTSPPTTDPNVTPLEIGETTSNTTILVVDLDGDGANDLVVTFDRSGLSGLSNDALVWFRNTLTPPTP